MNIEIPALRKPDSHKAIVVDFPGGGLGNQMFQFAFGLAIARRLNLPLQWSFKPNPKRKFELGLFGFGEEPYWYPPRVYTNMGQGRSLDLDCACAAVESSPQKFCGVQGHFQNADCFASVESEIRSIFSVQSAFLEVPAGCYPVAVQVRRDDYIGHPLFSVCDKSYFIKAMFHQEGQHLWPAKPHFFFISDDPDWCAKEFTGDDLTVLPKQTPYTALSVMAACKAHIISNSTFGWWGAWLARTECCTVPRRWMNGKYQGEIWDPAPFAWHRI